MFYGSENVIRLKYPEGTDELQTICDGFDKEEIIKEVKMILPLPFKNNEE